MNDALDQTHKYELTKNASGYDQLVSQLADGSSDPTNVRVNINLSVDVQLHPDVQGDLNLAMLCVAVCEDPSKSKTLESGKRLAGTVLRFSDDKELIYRQVLGLESFREWFWVV